MPKKKQRSNFRIDLHDGWRLPLNREIQLRFENPQD